MNTQNNRRSQETCDRMKQSMLELLEHIDILDITVSRLCDAAEVNRSTFYSHYDSIADIMEEIEREIGVNLLERFSEDNYDESNPFSMDHFTIVLEHMKENQNFYRAYLTQSTSQSQLDWAFGQLLEQFVRPMMHGLNVDDIAIEYYFAFFRAGFIALLSHWLQNRCREEPEVILSCLRNILSHPNFTI